MPGWSNDDLSQFWPLFIRNCRGLMRPTSGNLAAPAAPRRAPGSRSARRRPIRRARRRATARRAPLPANLSATLAAERRRRQAGHEHRHRLLRAAGARFAAAGRRLSMAAVHRAGGPADHRPGVGVSGTGRQRVRGKLDGKRVVPYDTRAAIEASGRRPPVLVWVDDPVDNFFLQVQGSGRVLLTDGPDSGKTIRVAYADHNGQPYASIGRWLIDRGELSADQASMQNIRAWAQRNPKRVPEMLNANPAVVFFREEAVVDPEQGPRAPTASPWRRSVRWRWTPVSCLWARRCSWPPRIPRPTGRCSGWCSPRTPAPPSRRGAGRLLLGLRRGSRAAGGPHEAARPDVAAVAQTGRGAQRAMTHQIVVCGAGIVGLSTALALARRGQRVAVLAPRASVPAAEPPARLRDLPGQPAVPGRPGRLGRHAPPADAGTGHGDLRRRRRRGPSQRLAGGAAAAGLDRRIGRNRARADPGRAPIRHSLDRGPLRGLRQRRDPDGERGPHPRRAVRGRRRRGLAAARGRWPQTRGGAVQGHWTGGAPGRRTAPGHRRSVVPRRRRAGAAAAAGHVRRRAGVDGLVHARRGRALLACRRASRPPRWKDCWRTRPRAGWAS